MFEVEKLRRYTDDAKGRRYEELKSLFPFEAAHDEEDADCIHHTCPEFKTEFLVDRFYHFEGRDKYLLLRKTIQVPEAKEGKNIVACFDFGITGGGHNNGFESVLYINGRIFQGVDSNHQEVFLDQFAGQEITLTFILWTGINEGRLEPLHHMLVQADIGYLNLCADQFYYLSRAVTETILFLPSTDSLKYDLIRIMENTYQLVDWSTEGYLLSVGKAEQYLETELAAIKKESPYTIHCFGHTHIDVAWLWRLKHTHEKSLRSFASVMRNMERYDEYRFIQSQPQLYQFIKEDDPDLYEQMTKRIAEDRWITDGAMWLEADCNISSGEALSRQMLYGTGYFEKEFQKKCSVLWLPDVFGYSWALPQILKESEIPYFVTTKISWNQVNSMPHDLFTWKGIDGSEVTTYFINTPDEGQPEDRWYATYNGFLSPETVLGTINRFKDKEYGRDMLISYGYGDGGGGPSREMLEMKRAMEKVPGLPTLVSDSVKEFLDTAKKQLDESHHRPLWDGELYLEYHRGTYTSQSFNKKMNRKSEFAMAETEFLNVLASEAGGNYPKETFDTCWTTILRNQFHDIIPGSSIHEVYEDSAKEYADVFSAVKEANSDALAMLVKEQECAATFWHTGAFEREDILQIPVKEEGIIFYNNKGEVLDSQKTMDGYLVKVMAQPFTLESIIWKKAETTEKASELYCDIKRRKIETPHYQISWNEKGHLTSVFDKDFDREVLEEGSCGNLLTLFEDRPMNYENWDIDCYYEEKSKVFSLSKEPEILECGNLQMVIRFTYVLGETVISQDMILYRDSRRIDFKTKVDWHEDHQLLKTVFKVDIRSQKASYDIQYGYVERPVHRNTSWDAARFESVGQKWADLSETDYGVSILNDCKYGYGIYENQMTLSLLKSTKYPDFRMDLGENSFTYSLLPHGGNAAAGDTIEESIILNQPLSVVPGMIKEGIGTNVIKLSGKEGEAQKKVIIDAVKMAEDGDGIIVRMHECRGSRADVKLDSGKGTSAEFCNIIEHAKGTKVHEDQMIRFRPFEIKNVRIR